MGINNKTTTDPASSLQMSIDQRLGWVASSICGRLDFSMLNIPPCMHKHMYNTHLQEQSAAGYSPGLTKRGPDGAAALEKALLRHALMSQKTV